MYLPECISAVSRLRGRPCTNRKIRRLAAIFKGVSAAATQHLTHFHIFYPSLLS